MAGSCPRHRVTPSTRGSTRFWTRPSSTHSAKLPAGFYPHRLGRPSLPPGQYFRVMMIGFFEGLDSERGIAWRLADSLPLRQFLSIGLDEKTPDHVTISRTRRRPAGLANHLRSLEAPHDRPRHRRRSRSLYRLSMRFDVAVVGLDPVIAIWPFCCRHRAAGDPRLVVLGCAPAGSTSGSVDMTSPKSHAAKPLFKGHLRGYENTMATSLDFCRSFPSEKPARPTQNRLPLVKSFQMHPQPHGASYPHTGS
jgi:Transposase domain (DUF772)